jgi:L-arabinokinase
VTSVFFYVSGHGFGHSVRQIEIINTLLALAGGQLRVCVRTSAAPWLFTRTVQEAIVLLPGETDTGAVQIDSLRLDERATIDVAVMFYETLPDRVQAEAALLAHHDAQLVIGDVPPLACAAAQAAGIPSVVCSNFTWDWIYRDYQDASAAGPQLISLVRELYGQATAAWRLPMHGGFETIDAVVDVPMVARQSRPERTVDEIRRALRLPAGRPLALVSFGGYGVRDLRLDRLDCLESWGVVVTSRDGETGALPEGIHAVPEDLLYDSGLRYEDLVRATDVVISKPGYGIISDCIGNGAAMLYTSRGRFAEYDVLVREMPRYLRCAYLDMTDLLNGRWQQGLDAAASAPHPRDRPRTDGADVVARLILERAGVTSLR